MKVWAWKVSGYVTGWSAHKSDDSQVEMEIHDAADSRNLNPSQLALDARNKRNSLLALSDWSVLSDSPLNDKQKQSWILYRQSLRELPEHQGFPQNINWPDAP